MGCCIPELAGDLVRTFVCIELPEAQREFLVKWIDAHRRCCSGIRWVAPDTMHITLKFCGERLPETIDKFKTTLSQIVSKGPISLSLEGIGGFPDFKRPHVIWTGIKGDLDRLSRLRDEIETAGGRVGIPKERAKYAPHLTLGRCDFSGGMAENIAASLNSEPVATEPWTAEQFILMRSELTQHGAVHTPIELFKI